MEYRTLGRTDLKISTVSLGCWAFAGGQLWGEQSQTRINDVVSAAIDEGVNFFDTAEAYGDGLSEERLAEALGTRRENILLATKVSGKNIADGKIRESCEASLARLRTETIDLYQLHWPQHQVPLEDTLGELTRLQQEGKIREIGVSNFGPLDMDDLVQSGRVESNQLLYNLLCRQIEDQVIPRCIAQEMSVLCYSPLAQGLLTGKWKTVDDVPSSRARNRLFSSENPEAKHDEPGCEAEVFRALQTVREICEELGQPMAAVAMAWCLHKPGITSVLVGAQSVSQLKINVGATDLRLGDEVMKRLDEATLPVKRKLGVNLDILFSGERSRYR